MTLSIDQLFPEPVKSDTKKLKYGFEPDAEIRADTGGHNIMGFTKDFTLPAGFIEVRTYNYENGRVIYKSTELSEVEKTEARELMNRLAATEDWDSASVKTLNALLVNHLSAMENEEFSAIAIKDSDDLACILTVGPKVYTNLGDNYAPLVYVGKELVVLSGRATNP